MNLAITHPNERRARTGTQVVLVAVWWLGAAAMLLPVMMLTVVSDHPEDRYPGLVILGLVVAAVWAGVRLWSGPANPRARALSLAVSGLWFVGAALVYPTQNFTADAVFAAGVPALVAVITAGLALMLRPDTRAEAGAATP